MQFEIEVLSVGEEQTTKTARGGYQHIEVAYKKDGKIEGKKIMSFSNPAVFKAVKGLNAGDVATVTAEKGEPNASGQSFWQWTNVSTGGEPASVGSVTKASTPTAATKPVSNYETREERELKQRYIVRQSSITAAINLLGAKAKTIDDVTTVAKQFESYVFGDVNYDLPNSLEDFEDDVPL